VQAADRGGYVLAQVRYVLMVEGGRPRTRAWRHVAAGGAAGFGLSLVVLSPFGLSALAKVGERDWQRLSEIGQTYGAVSALLAALALGGVAVSINQQRQAAQVDREHVFRAVNLELTRMMLEHPDLMGSYASTIGARSVSEQRLNLYCNQQVLALEMGFEIGALNEPYLVETARELFGSPTSRDWWARVRDAKRATAMSGRQHRVLDILDDEWARAPTSDDRQRPAARSPRPSTVLAGAPWLRSHARTTAGLVAAGALLVALRRRRRTWCR